MSRTRMSSSSSSAFSNLQRFLDCATPTIPSQLLPRSCIRDLKWHPIEKETIEYFTLGDLWDRYDESSAYGVGVPIVLNSGETIVQYYVPYLSAIQIYTGKSFANFRNLREESDLGESESDSCSDESESDKLSRSLSNNSSGASYAASEDSSVDQEGCRPMRDRLGDHLYMDYFERCGPHGRIPLMDKITELSRTYPGLMSFKSVDLSPASWMAVAWYPIYHIPMGRNVRDLSTCFLTYHTLSSSLQDDLTEDKEDGIGERKCEVENSSISLEPFGLATYKMQGYLWIPETSDHESIIRLMSAADSWLKQLRVQHPDYNYFTDHSM